MENYLKAVQVTEKVWWVGAIDWNLREFHGYRTARGSTYNAFLVLADKITLVDTVKAPFKDEMMQRIASVIGDPAKIDYIVSNHAEMDHSGALPAVIAEVKPEKVFASAMGVKALDAHFRIGSALTPVKTGEVISLGNMSMTFVETRMLHWPDSMVSYIPEQKILFSQDGFGMHQFSVYIRHCASYGSAEVHIERVKHMVPDEGSVSILKVTDKQFENTIHLVGKKAKPPPATPSQLEFF